MLPTLNPDAVPEVAIKLPVLNVLGLEFTIWVETEGNVMSDDNWKYAVPVATE